MQSDVSSSDFCWDDWNRTQQAYVYLNMSQSDADFLTVKSIQTSLKFMTSHFLPDNLKFMTPVCLSESILSDLLLMLRNLYYACL